jgi:hypothetical protein
MIKSQFIKDILDLLLDGREGQLFRHQFESLTDTKYKYTGSGVFVTFIQTEDNVTTDSPDIVLDGVEIQSGDILADAILFIKNGHIGYLEIWCKSGTDYPDHDLSTYVLTQSWTDSPGRTIKKTYA